MAGKKKYHKLDDVGFLGVAKARSGAAIKRDAYLTSEFIKQYHTRVTAASKGSPVNRFKKRTALKAVK